MKKVVIVAPTYNEKGEIENLVSKVFEQSKKVLNWEIYLLIVDSHSTDGTIEIVKRLQKKFLIFIYWKRKKKDWERHILKDLNIARKRSIRI